MYTTLGYKRYVDEILGKSAIRSTINKMSKVGLRTGLRARLGPLHTLRNYSNDVERSAMKERFEQILDSKLDSITTTSIENNPELEKIYAKYKDPDHVFQHKHQAQLTYLKLEPLLARNKHAREIADTLVNKPWTGTETVHDANLRMLIDSSPKEMKIITPKVPVKERIHNAFEGSLDYKLAKISEQPSPSKESESESFRELYRERLLGPSVFMNSSASSSIGLITTMADVRINEQIDKKSGKFEEDAMTNVRGKPLSKDHLANCTDTNYFMNQILQKQECLPPWIESQKGVDQDIERLRFELDRDWSFRMLDNIKRKFPGQKGIELSNSAKSSDLLDSGYHSLKMRYLEPKIKEINLKITTYNLSSPSLSLHKWKLVPEKELENLYKRVLANIDTLIEQNESQQKMDTLKLEHVTQEKGTESLGFLRAIKSLLQ